MEGVRTLNEPNRVIDRDFKKCVKELEQAKEIIAKSCVYIALAEFPEKEIESTVQYGQAINREINKLIERLNKAENKFEKEMKIDDNF